MIDQSKIVEKATLVINAMTRKQEEYLKTVPTLSKGIVKHAYTRIIAPKRHIKAKCLDCTNYQREEITKCPVETCPLWAIRPFQ